MENGVFWENSRISGYLDIWISERYIVSVSAVTADIRVSVGFFLDIRVSGFWILKTDSISEYYLDIRIVRTEL